MATWEKTKTIEALFASFNQRFPNRSKASDGTIGDTAHSTGKSGHNPDKPYPLPSGGSAEYEDNDGRAEVRAGDVTAALNGDVTMQQVIDAIRADSDDRNRFAYIIYNRRICSANNGWVWETYDGDNPHDKHAHFSSKPAADNDASLFESILNVGEGVMPEVVWTESEQAEILKGIRATRDRTQVIFDGNDYVEPKWSASYQPGQTNPNMLKQQIEASNTATVELSQAQLDYIADRVAAVLAPSLTGPRNVTGTLTVTEA